MLKSIKMQMFCAMHMKINAVISQSDTEKHKTVHLDICTGCHSRLSAQSPVTVKVEGRVIEVMVQEFVDV